MAGMLEEELSDRFELSLMGASGRWVDGWKLGGWMDGSWVGGWMDGRWAGGWVDGWVECAACDVMTTQRLSPARAAEVEFPSCQAWPDPPWDQHLSCAAVWSCSSF